LEGKPDISFVIVNFQGRRCIGKCLSSLKKAVGRYSYEVIVIDNNSFDESIPYLQENFPEVTLICNNFNGGYSFACNQGIAISKGEYLCMLNPDLYLHPQAMEILIDYLQEHSDVGAVSPNLLNCDGSLQPVCRKFIRNRNLVMKHVFPWKMIPADRIGRFVLEYWDHSSTRDVDWFCGACMVFPRFMLDLVGLKDENFWAFHEDTDWLMRVHETGYRVVFVHQAVGVHEGGHSMGQLFKDRKILYEYQAKHQIIRKFYGRHSFLIHRFLLVGLLLMRRLKYMLLNRHENDLQQRLEIIDHCITLQVNLIEPPPLWDHDPTIDRKTTSKPGKIVNRL